MRSLDALALEFGRGVHATAESPCIGIRDSARPELGDGVVPLESATWPVGSVDHVEGAHDLQTAPATIAILKRILLERLARHAEQP